MRRILLLFMVWFLQGCSTLEVQPVFTPKAHSIPESWQVSGRVSVVFDGRVKSAGFMFAVYQQRYRIKLSGPFGFGQRLIESNPAGLRVDGKIRKVNFKQWMTTTMGWHFPLPILAKVLFQHRERFDDNWAIEIVSYQKIGQLSYPKTIRLRHLSKPIKIKLVIDSVFKNSGAW